MCKKPRPLTHTAIVWFLSEETNQPNGGHECTDELRIGLAELLCKARLEHDADFLTEGIRILSQVLVEMEVEEQVGRGATSARSSA